MELPGGETRIGAQEQNVRTLGTISSVQELAALPVSLGDGRNMRLDAIANVRDQAAEVRQEVLLDGKPVIGFRVFRAWGEGALKVADGARAAVKDLQEQVSADPDHRDRHGRRPEHPQPVPRAR